MLIYGHAKKKCYFNMQDGLPYALWGPTLLKRFFLHILNDDCFFTIILKTLFMTVNKRTIRFIINAIGIGAIGYLIYLINTVS